MENNKIERIIKLVLDGIAEIYLYFLAFYLVCSVLSCFFESWKLFFNWQAFHIGVVVLGILSLLSDKGKQFILSQKELVKFREQSKLSFVKNILKNLVSFFIQRLSQKLKALNKKDFLKIGIIVIILVYFLHREINTIDFFVLAYALISILFIVESRVAAGIALICLISCPFLLIYKKELIAEIMAIYAYYFLVIAVITQIREYIKERGAVENS